jgi:hypothetical protein
MCAMVYSQLMATFRIAVRPHYYGRPLEQSTHIFGTRCTAVLGSYEDTCGEVSLRGRWWVVTGVAKPGLIRPRKIKSGTIGPNRRVQNCNHVMGVRFEVHVSPCAGGRVYLVRVKLVED